MTTTTIRLESLPFPNYTQLSSFLPRTVWHFLRALSVAAALLMADVLWNDPDLGLRLFWGLAVPILPLIFFVAPGVWRNICPLAASNQLPRLAGISRAATNSKLSEGLAFPIGMLGFFVLVACRKLIFNSSGAATALLIIGAMVAALVGGLLFKGKSGWCSSICPLLPVQRLYGQTPFVKVANTHCQPCVGCAKNCYDFNPGTAYLADQYDARRGYRSFRRFFAGVFPGFVLAYYLVPSPPLISVSSMVVQMLLYMAISLALFNLLDMLLQTMVNVAPIVFAVVAINIFYWFSATTVVATLSALNLPTHAALVWGLRATVLIGSLVWLWRSTLSERLYLAHQEHQAKKGQIEPTPIVLESLTEFSSLLSPARQQLAANGDSGKRAEPDAPPACAPHESGKSELCIVPDDKRTPLRPGQSLLDAIEACGGAIESGCRMGVCGADPIAVTEGMAHLSPIGADEKATLQRLGCASNTRMACSARLRGQGQVSIELKPQRQDRPALTPVPTPAGDPAIRSVVIIGNGIAGITAAEHVRRLHTECEIHVVSRENHALYNRMGISRLINGRSGMHGLYLLPESWYQEQRLTNWFNTHVVKIDTDQRLVHLATNEQLAYDRLIFANGSSPCVPAIEGYGMPGSFLLREADEAMGMRDYIQRNGSRTAVVAGAGLLGLEAAHALQKLGLEVTVLSNTAQILGRQLDSRGSALLQRYLEGQGIAIRPNAEAVALDGDQDGRVRSVKLNDGQLVPADIFVACTGVKPNVDLAKAAGIATARGIIVDDCMRTNLADVYAAGDVAEYKGVAHGLWPVAVEQGEVAATNALGGDRRYSGHIPLTLLKVTGIDVLSIGNLNAQVDDTYEIVQEDPEAFAYRKLVFTAGCLAGAILIGHPDQAELIAGLVKQNTDLTPVIPALHRGNWKVLAQFAMAA